MVLFSYYLYLHATVLVEITPFFLKRLQSGMAQGVCALIVINSAESRHENYLLGLTILQSYHLVLSLALVLTFLCGTNTVTHPLTCGIYT